MSWARGFVKRIQEKFAGKRQAPLPRTSSPPRFRSEPEMDVCWPHDFETKVQPSSPDGPQERFRVCKVCGAEDDGEGGPTAEQQRATGGLYPARDEKRETKPAVTRDWHGREEG